MSALLPRASIATGLTILFLVLSSCRNFEHVQYPGQPPVKEIDVLDGAVTVLLENDADIHRVINMRIFSGVGPDMSVSEIETLTGALAREMTFLESPAFFFDLQEGKVALVRRRVESEGTAAWKWELYAFPSADTVTDIIAADVLAQLPSLDRVDEVAIVGGSGQDTLVVATSRGRVEWVYWSRRDINPFELPDRQEGDEELTD